MAHLDVDFTLPIALLVSSLIAVVLVRLAVQRGEKAAEARTRRLIRRHGMRAMGRASDD